MIRRRMRWTGWRGCFRTATAIWREVTRALVAMDAAWADPLAKVKSHHDYLIAVHRAGGHVTPNPRSYFAPLRLLARMPFSGAVAAGLG